MAYQQDAQERAQAYGVKMDEPLLQGDIDRLREGTDHGTSIYLDDPRLMRVVRLRLVGCCRDTPWWDVSYCYGEVKPDSDIQPREGKQYVRVIVPLRQIKRNWRAAFVEWGKANRVFVKGLGIFDGDTVSTLNG